jgi:hypothetical protein
MRTSTIDLEYSAESMSSSEISLTSVGLIKAPLDNGFSAHSNRNSGLNYLEISKDFIWVPVYNWTGNTFEFFIT